MTPYWIQWSCRKPPWGPLHLRRFFLTISCRVSSSPFQNPLLYHQFVPSTIQSGPLYTHSDTDARTSVQIGNSISIVSFPTPLILGYITYNPLMYRLFLLHYTIPLELINLNRYYLYNPFYWSSYFVLSCTMLINLLTDFSFWRFTKI